MTCMTHDGYVARIDLDEEADLFHGDVINTRDVLAFQGQSLDDLTNAFADTIADYLEWCQDCGKEPDRSDSGKITVTLPPNLHHQIAVAAANQGISLNSSGVAALGQASD